MKLTKYDLGWLVGILEGEGCFTTGGKSPRICLAMTDEDVVFRVAKFFKVEVYKRERQEYRPEHSNAIWKPIYEISICGETAREFMTFICPFMSVRRQNRIKELLGNWEHRPIKHLSKQQIIALRQDFISGLDSKQLSNKYGITPECINRHIKDLRVEQEKEFESKVVSDFKSGLTRKQLAEKYNKNYEVLNRLLRRAGFTDSTGLRRWQTRRQVGV